MAKSDCEHSNWARCGNCNRSWCSDCDPAPGAHCHWCTGRGYSEYELKDPDGRFVPKGAQPFYFIEEANNFAQRISLMGVVMAHTKLVKNYNATLAMLLFLANEAALNLKSLQNFEELAHHSLPEDLK